MGLKAIIDKLEDVAEHFRELYTERNGKFELTGVEGMRTQADIDRLSSGLEKERTDHKATKLKLSAFGDLDPDKVRLDLGRIPELEARASGNKLNETQIEQIVNTRTASIVGPLQLKLTQAESTIQENEQVIQTFKTQNKQNSISGAVRDAIGKAKVLPHATEDVLLLAERHFDIAEDGRVVTKSNLNGVVAGIEPSVWLTQLQASRPHWWGTSMGGGAGGNGGSGGTGNNPFSAQHWNMTEQVAMMKENMGKAEQMAAAAGTTIGGPRPAEKK